LRAVVGLGNIGKRYELTRHNVGFSLLDRFADYYHISFQSSKQNYLYAKGQLENSPFILAKPITYMNLSGIAVYDLIEKYELELVNMLIIHDDVDLQLGKIKIKQSGGSGGHNGVNSIIYHLNNDRFPRLRFGIGRVFSKGEMVDFVLNDFFTLELEQLKKTFDFGCRLIEKFILGGIKTMLNYYSNSSERRIE
jgi:PTH1 family peptidyl-tRNA hydrolase